MTTASAASAVPGASSAPSTLRLALVHAKYSLLETMRVPIAVIGTLVFPALALLFFVVPQRAVAEDPLVATAAVTQLGTFAVMSACLFSFGVGVSEDRALPFDPFLRTLPAGAGPRLAGRVVNGVLWSYLALLPLVLLGWLATSATLTVPQALAAVVMVPLVAVPFVLLGLAIGYRLTSKAAIAVVQATLFPLAFAGGLFMPPQAFPAWLDSISRLLPSRAARDLSVQAVTGDPAPAGSLLVLALWTVLFAVLAVLAYRGDEGRRFH
jgi:ABC-2 type transport system permease protein